MLKKVSGENQRVYCTDYIVNNAFLGEVNILWVINNTWV